MTRLRVTRVVVLTHVAEVGDRTPTQVAVVRLLTAPAVETVHGETRVVHVARLPGESLRAHACVVARRQVDARAAVLARRACAVVRRLAVGAVVRLGACALVR